MNTLVVARHDEHVGWTGQIPAGWTVHVVQKDMDLPNRGREPSSFLWFILAAYDRIDPDALYGFVQGDPFPHCPNLPQRLSEPVDGFAPLGGGIHPAQLYSDSHGLPHHPGLPVAHYHQRWLGRPMREEVGFWSGGQFVITGRRLLSRPKAFYQAIYSDLMAEDEDDRLPYVVERLWPTIFGHHPGPKPAGKLKLLAFQDGSACGFYRIVQPLGEMERHGHRVRIVHGNADPDPDTDIVVGERLDHPEALPTWRRWRARHRLVYEIDDDVWSVDPVNQMAWRVYRHEVPRDVTTHMAQTADLVTCSTQVLADQVARQTGQPNIAVLPNYIDEGVLNLQRPRRDKVTVGWAGGASHGRDLHMVAAPLRRFLQRNPQVEFHLVGSDFRGDWLGGIECRWTDWAPNVHDYYRLLDFDIGLIPVWDNAFGRAKSHSKALEYAALGIPVIASDLEPYREFVLDGTTGFLVRHDHEWARRLRQLVNDPQMREEMGAKAREHAAAFTIQGNWQQWEAAYSSLR